MVEVKHYTVQNKR